MKTETPEQSNSHSVLTAELQRLEMVIGRAGLHYSEETTAEEVIEHAEVIEEEIQNIQIEIQKLHEQSLASGEPEPFVNLCDAFQLDDLEKDILLLCIAPELDENYAAMYAGLYSAPSKFHASLHVFQTLLGLPLELRGLLRDACSPHGKLAGNELIRVAPFKNDEVRVISPIIAEERIVSYLLGGNAPDPMLAEFLHPVQPEEAANKALGETIKQSIANIAKSQKQQPEPTGLLYFYGRTGAGKLQAAAHLAQELNLRTYRMNLRTMLAQNNSAPETLRRALREARLSGLALCLEDFDQLADITPDGPLFQDYLLEQIQGFQGLLVFLGENALPTALESGARRKFISLEFPVPLYKERKGIWETGLNGAAASLSAESLEKLAASFRFSPGQIRSSLERAKTSAMLRGAEGYTEADILAGCYAESNHQLSKLAEKVSTGTGWTDIVLPNRTLTQLYEIRDQLMNHVKLQETWGFARRDGRSRGINVLFSGQSGTGKTMSAGIIARELKLELYKIDLSRVVDKYIGETEKNLSKIFQEAENSGAVLFFDEADAIFGKRSEVKDAHDRYANIETSYLLQKMEDHPGMCILATNLRNNMDQAFTRRIRHLIEFPFPDKPERMRIWQGVFPKETPLDADLDYEFLGEKLHLAGGSIKNTALNAAYFAIADDSSVKMIHILKAAQREYEKEGRPFYPAEMGQYGALIGEV